MRFVFPEIGNIFDFGANYINTLVIENRSLFSRLVKDIHNQIKGFEGMAVLSKNYTPISMDKNAELIQDFIGFDVNTKGLISKMNSAIEKTALDEENYLETQSLMTEIENRISLWAFNFPCDIVTTKISLASIIKACGVEVRDNYEERFGDAEKIIDYMELVREFDKEKLFITVNMRAFFEDDIIEKFMETSISHEYKILMIESQSYSRLSMEKRFTIDEDLCEF